MEASVGFDIAYAELRPHLVGYCKLEKVKPNKDKLTRAQPWLQLAEAGKLFMVTGEWNKELCKQLAMFPDNGSTIKDDIIDAISHAYAGVYKNTRLFLA